MLDREEEMYIAPFIPNWQDRYYKTLFDWMEHKNIGKSMYKLS